MVLLLGTVGVVAGGAGATGVQVSQGTTVLTDVATDVERVTGGGQGVVTAGLDVSGAGQEVSTTGGGV